MRVLLTGASGFLGFHTARALLEAGHEVIALVRPDALPQRLTEIASSLVLLRGDLYNLDTFQPALARWCPEACLHLAWYAEPGKYLHSSQNILALSASLELLAELKRLGCRHFIGAGTCAEYDAGLGWMHEDGPTKPETLYAASKLSLCLLAPHLAGPEMRVAWARIFYPYGPEEDPRRAVPALIGSLLRCETFAASEGTQVRDYVHVEDIAAGFCRLLAAEASGVYNIASGEPITMRRVMEIIGGITGQSELIRFGTLPLRDWDPKFICADTQRLRALGWSPRYSLEEGLAQTILWWQGNFNKVDGG